MAPTGRKVTGWDYLTLSLWSLFFAVGLVPEPVFFALRELASVSSHRALVNSSAVITVSFAVYLGFFVRQKCREAGMTGPEAQARGVQVALLGLVAFLEIPNGGAADGRTFLEFMIRYREINDTYVRYVVLAVGMTKLAVWWYLFSLILRFHAFGNRQVFRHMLPLVPSAHSSGQNDPEAHQYDRDNGQHSEETPGKLHPPAGQNDEWSHKTERPR